MKIGDSLTFKAATRCSYRKATRKITGFDNRGRPLVRYAGWSDFIVQPHEILGVERKAWQRPNVRKMEAGSSEPAGAAIDPREQ